MNGFLRKCANVASPVVPRIGDGDAENWNRVWVRHGLLFWHTFGTVCCFYTLPQKLCMDIDIREEWFGIANCLNSFLNNRVMALGWCKNEFFLNIFRINGWILIKFGICIDMYEIRAVSNAHYFRLIFNRVMTLDLSKTNVFFLNISRTNGWILIKVCICIDMCMIHVVSNARYFWSFLTELWPLIDGRTLFMLNILWINVRISIKFCIHALILTRRWRTLIFIHFQQSCGPWLMSKFRSCLMSYGSIDGFW